MNLRELIQRVRKSISPQEQLPNEAILGFLRVLEETDDEELSCDEIFNKLDEYVEREVDKKDAAHLMPLIREHLDLCPDCCEEYEALLDVIEKTDEK
jgi:hypothetical protein